MASILDLLPTIAALTGATVPCDRVIDGKDISGLLFEGEASGPGDRLFCYYFGAQLQAGEVHPEALVGTGPEREVMPDGAPELPGLGVVEAVAVVVRRSGEHVDR